MVIAGQAAASDIKNGQKIYRQNCSSCHGNNGQAVMAGAPDFNRGRGLFKSDHELLKRIQLGKNACPAYRGILSEQKIFDVIAYIRTFR
jgi:mono/diheme cytochrome c family protein